jgi:amino acid transporter
MIPVVYVYAYMAVSMPRSGADYVWVSRVIHGLPGFMIGWAFWVGVYCVGGGGNAYSFGTVGLPDTLTTLGYALHYPSLISLTSTLSQPVPAFIMGVGLLILGALIGGSSIAQC